MTCPSLQVRWHKKLITPCEYRTSKHLQVQVHHSPIDMYNSGNISALGLLLVERDIGYYSKHKLITQN
jgi:hypothetical protein